MWTVVLYSYTPKTIVCIPVSNSRSTLHFYLWTSKRSEMAERKQEKTDKQPNGTDTFGNVGVAARTDVLWTLGCECSSNT